MSHQFDSRRLLSFPDSNYPVMVGHVLAPYGFLGQANDAVIEAAGRKSRLLQRPPSGNLAAMASVDEALKDLVAEVGL